MAALAAVAALGGCAGVGDGGTAGTGGSDAQTPPRGESALTAWLAEGSYKQWACEPHEHEPSAASAHTVNRICSNALLSAAPDDQPFPGGAAAVKELFDAIGGPVTGHAVYLKTADDSADGAGWYWFEANPGVFADGLGGSGRPKSSCVGCHAGAPHDFAWTQVK
jgi:hypothetical protein